MKKIMFLLIGFIAYGIVAGNSAEPAAPNQLSEAVSKTIQLQTKLDQVRALLSETRDLLKQEDKILAATRDQKEQAKKDDISLAEHKRALDVISQEIQKLRDQIKEAEKELATQAKQAAQYSRVQEEYTQAQKERLDCEAKARQAEDNLAAAQKNLAEFKGKIADTMKQVNDLKKTSGAPENAAADLKTEKAHCAEALIRAEKAVTMAEKTEKERLLLADRLGELQRNLSAQQQDSIERAKLESELENEKKTLRETEEKIRQETRSCGENEKAIAELKEKIKALQETEHLGSQKEDNTKRLQARLATIRSQRAATEEQARKAEGKLKAGEASVAELTNMLAAAERQQEKDQEKTRAIAALTDELNKETALMDEALARLDKQSRDRKALEDEKNRLSQHLILVKEKLGREEQNLNKPDEIRQQIAELKKNRLDTESKLQQISREQEALEKEKETINQALIASGTLILKNEKDIQDAGQVAAELQEQKELAQKSAGLLREKEESVKQLLGEKAALQGKLDEAEAKLARQNEHTKYLEEKRHALDEEKKAKLDSEKRYRELAQTEKEYKKQVKELKSKTQDAAGKSEALSSQTDIPAPAASVAKAAAADKSPRRETLMVAQAKAEHPQNSIVSGAGTEAQDNQGGADTAPSSGKDVLSVEQDILDKARSDGAQPSGQDIATDQRQGKKAARQTGSNRQVQIEQAEEHYQLGIKKWDADDLDGAIAEFKKTIRLNPDAAGAYYNISLVCLRQGKSKEACDYAYQAGECYVRTANLPQAARMAVLLTKIDQKSPLVLKLRNKIAAATNQ